MLRLLDSKTRIFNPSEAKNARFQASLSSPAWRGTMPVQPSNGFFTHKLSQIMGTDFAGENQRADVSASPTVALSRFWRRFLRLTPGLSSEKILAGEI